MESTAYDQNKLRALKEAVVGFAAIVTVDLSGKTTFEQDVYKNASVQK